MFKSVYVQVCAVNREQPRARNSQNSARYRWRVFRGLETNTVNTCIHCMKPLYAVYLLIHESTVSRVFVARVQRS